jgi:glyoxylase-like metal-dependent hydrolase (beta-lactamase superfamily II)
MGEVTRFNVGEPIQVAGSAVKVRRLLAPNAGPMTGPGTNTYLVGSEVQALVDPGPDEQSHLVSIMDAIDGRQLRWILVTHTHADHSPAAAKIAGRTGAELVGMPAPAGGHHDRSFAPARAYADGEILSCADFSIELIHTPGHVSNHTCYLLKEEKLLFTGDHILQGTTSVILPPDGDMADYMTSLHGLRARQLDYLAPGHGDIMDDPAASIDHLIAHRNRREEKIISAMASTGACDIEALTLLVYDDVAPHLLPWARLTLEAHLIKLGKDSKAMKTPRGWELL